MSDNKVIHDGEMYKLRKNYYSSCHDCDCDKVEPLS